MENQNSVTYAEAGVDIVEGARAVDAIKDTVHSTYRPEVVGDIGGFGGLFEAADGCVVEINEQAARFGVDRGVDDLMRCGGYLRTAVGCVGHRV